MTDNPVSLALRAHALTLPADYGTYLFNSADNTVLYVGKSNNIKKRVLSYFTGQNKNKKIQRLLAASATIDFILTNNEHEALILENNLIKTHKPEFNVLLKHGSGYPYLAISGEDYPKISVTYKVNHRLTANDVDVYGPYIEDTRVLIAHITKLFGIRTCQNSYFKSRIKPCMRHDIGLCSAPCVGMISKDAYAKNVRHAALLLGRDVRYRDRLAANIRLKMLASSKILDFERANEYKLNIASIEFIASCQAVELTNKVDIDVISRSINKDSVVYSIIKYINGVLLEKLCFEFHPSMENDSHAALRIIYKNTKLPTQVVIETPAVNDDAAAFFAQQNVEVLAPEQVMQLAIIAHKNLTAVNSDKSSLEDAGVNALCSLLKIDAPSRIECIDISHMAGKSAYGSLIVWDEGSLNKRLYRSYKLSDSYDGNDYAAISQVVKRRYNDNPLPDILVIDGGKAHLDYLVNEINQNATLSAKMHACELIGIVKAEGRNPTKDRLFIYSSSSFTTFNEHTNVLRFIQTLRDEAHRFAGKMMHRDKALLQQRSLLTAIPGIGGKKQRSLMEFFGNSALIATATLAQLIAAPGIGQQTALVIYRHFHPNELSK